MRPPGSHYSRPFTLGNESRGGNHGEDKAVRFVFIERLSRDLRDMLFELLEENLIS